MGGRAGTGRRLWLSCDCDGTMWLWWAKPIFDGEEWWDMGAVMGRGLRVDGAWMEYWPDRPPSPGECIELREVRRVKGGE